MTPPARLPAASHGYPNPMDDNERTANPVSWYAIERGWRVMTLDGVSLGTVEEVQSDEELDIFHGLSVRVGIGRLPREVPAELVSAIEPGVVTVAILSDEIGTLPSAD
jgi:hypothetical protein